jgi:O-antigen/teichoic acid export membrane protein
MHLFRGSAWMVGLRWAIRLTGVVSTVILARLLTPADFGVVAMAMIVVGMLEMLGQTGQAAAIIRHANPDRELYDAAWTISVLSGFAIAVTIIAVAPLTKAYFHEPRAVLVMQCLALRAALGGLENIGMVNLSRDLRFGSVFQYNIYTKLFSFCVTVILAFILRNYWALVAGILSAQTIRIALSYVLSSYRPRLSFVKLREIFSFSLWSLVRSVGSYLNGLVDQIAVGGVAGTSAMGRYAVASDVAASPSMEIMWPLTWVLYPVMAKHQDDPRELRRLYLQSLGWTFIICASTSVGVALVAPDMVRLVLGPKWVDVIPLMGWLALDAGLMGLCLSAYSLLDVVNLPHVGARMQWLRLLLLAVAVFPVAYLTRNVVMVAEARFLMTALFIPSLFFTVGRHANVSKNDYFLTLWRPFVAAAAMALAVWSVNQVIPFTGNLRLVLDIVLGAAAYAGVISALWRLSGCPDSAERDALTIIERLRTKFLKRATVADAAPSLTPSERLSPPIDPDHIP